MKPARVSRTIATRGATMTRRVKEDAPEPDRFHPTCSDCPGGAGHSPSPRQSLPDPLDDLDRLVLLYEVGRFEELDEVKAALGSGFGEGM